MENELLIAALVQAVIGALNTPVVTWVTRWINNQIDVRPFAVNALILPLLTAVSQGLAWIVAEGNVELQPVFAVFAIGVTSWTYKILKNFGVVTSTLTPQKRRRR